jgi:hypothetical protein
LKKENGGPAGPPPETRLDFVEALHVPHAG